MARLVIKLCGACFVALLVFGMVTMAYADTPPDEVKRAAEEGLPELLSVMPREELEHFGFKSVDELKIAALGEPYQVHTITPQDLKSYEKGTKLSSLISETNLWYFPIMVDGEARTILTVDFFEGRWQAVGIGDTPLARKLQSLSTQLPILLRDKEVNGVYSTKFVRIFQVYTDFLAVDSSRGEFIILVNPDRLGMQSNKLYGPEEIMPKVAESVQQAIQSEGEFGGGAAASAPEKEAGGRTAIYVLAFGAVALVGLAIGLLKARRVF